MNSKEFILPKDWCIKINEENIDLLIQWRKDTFNLISKISINGYVYSWVEMGIGGGWSFGDVVEITTEQFKTYVLKINSESILNIKDDSSNYLIKLLKEIGI